MNVMHRLKSIASGRPSVPDPGGDSSIKRVKVEQEVDHEVDIEIQLDKHCNIALKGDVTFTSEGSAASTLNIDTRQENCGYKDHELCRGLNYMHNVVGVCHRDIKPQNLLVNPHTHQLKICDFGSAKMLVPGEPNIAYICCRYYRAPELIFGATEYTTTIDLWSAGCVFAELLLGQPLFPGESGVDQLVEIIKILGTTTREEIRCMNPNYTNFKFPQVKARPWHKIFRRRIPPEAVDLASRMLQYSPTLRCTALEACAHPFLDALRKPNACFPNGRPLPPLFNFTPQELSGAPTELRERLIPEHTRKLTLYGRNIS